MQFGSDKHVDVARLKADLAAAAVELLSAHCAADRLRLQYSPQDIVSFGERSALKRAISSAEALYISSPKLRRTSSRNRRRQIGNKTIGPPSLVCTFKRGNGSTSPRG